MLRDRYGDRSNEFLKIKVHAFLCYITAAVTGPPPKNYDFKTRVIGGSRSPHCSVAIGLNSHFLPRTSTK
jgi:hypothetical protein